MVEGKRREQKITLRIIIVISLFGFLLLLLSFFPLQRLRKRFLGLFGTIAPRSEQGMARMDGLSAFFFSPSSARDCVGKEDEALSLCNLLQTQWTKYEKRKGEFSWPILYEIWFCLFFS